MCHRKLYLLKDDMKCFSKRERIFSELYFKEYQCSTVFYTHIKKSVSSRNIFDTISNIYKIENSLFFATNIEKKERKSI